ncbi:conserved hypothetical protein [Bradyrhizobium sp. ORS 375]|uniref:hypothetical protein n=1 Tax=Bradyrhizobium sp. (strain ORS 375) TaxID=566679 RepID=UPI0002407AF4|nr:hypothetical protein [Bradyrhizobium sp. ORS 375]CCD95750.1 conserved hypothetical protein [Bradyrhizobium sp. ORS 375]
MPFTIRLKVVEPHHVEEAAMLLTDLLGTDDGASRLSARGRHRVRIDQMLRADAWIDAALELVALQLPGWSLRRLAYDGGEWHCALSQRREMPDWLDHCAEARHSDPALAILHAALEAQGRTTQSPPGDDRGAARGAPLLADILCCDNF